MSQALFSFGENEQREPIYFCVHTVAGWLGLLFWRNANSKGLVSGGTVKAPFEWHQEKWLARGSGSESRRECEWRIWMATFLFLAAAWRKNLRFFAVLADWTWMKMRNIVLFLLRLWLLDRGYWSNISESSRIFLASNVFSNCQGN